MVITHTQTYKDFCLIFSPLKNILLFHRNLNLATVFTCSYIVFYTFCRWKGKWAIPKKIQTSFLINPWRFHTLFLWYSWKFHILTPLFGFFSRIAQWGICHYSKDDWWFILNDSLATVTVKVSASSSQIATLTGA